MNIKANGNAGKLKISRQKTKFIVNLLMHKHHIVLARAVLTGLGITHEKVGPVDKLENIVIESTTDEFKRINDLLNQAIEEINITRH